MKFGLLALLLSLVLLGGSLLKAQGLFRSPARTDQFASVRLIGGNERKIALGRDLFFDRRLSGSMRTNCASCHDLDTNGATANRIDRIDARQTMTFNTPTVFNSVYNSRFGWAGKVRTMREIVLRALRTAMVGINDVPAQRLAADPAMSQRFRAIYKSTPKESYIVDALTAFTSTLVTPNSPFDRWLEGDAKALTPQQQRGYARFKALGCASCHQGRNIGANVIERHGIFHPLGNQNPRYLRVPSLRNVAVTAPYFADGSSATLPDAIRQMARVQLDLAIGENDVKDITAFLRSLNGFYKGRPVRPASKTHK